MAGINDPYSEKDYKDAAKAMVNGVKIPKSAQEKVIKASKQAGSLGSELRRILK